MSPVLLSISIVTYRLDFPLFAQVLKHLHAALQHLARQHPQPVRISIVDNGNEAAKLRELLDRSAIADLTDITSAGRNLGYGKAHNLAISAADSSYHLVMNPDVFIAEDALTLAVNFLEQHPDVAALSPYAVDGAGETAFLCKRYPTLLDLALRGFAPGALRRRFSERLDQYENRELVARQQPAEVDLISGCFMFCRTEALRQTGGFNPVFFLYFEDFSLSLELQKFGRLMYVPACRITHYGGNAGKKGLRHVLHFVASATRFYNQYGWKLL
jgi:GT2 family glycosyltransferase